MTDQELDRALAEAVNVGHSADFLARVRSVVAAEPAPARWHLPWSFAAAGAAVVTAAGVVVIVGWLANEHDLPAQTPLVVSDSHTSLRAVEGTLVASSTSPSNVVPTRQQVRPRGKPRATSRFPEVVVSRDDARAFDLLIRSARLASIPDVLPMDDLSPSEALTLPRIEIPPVDIQPLPQVARLEQGDRP